MNSPRLAATRSGARALLGVVALAACVASGCQQKMAEQPYYKPYEHSDFFPDGRSARPLEAGTVHRGQSADDSPLVTGLTADEWKRVYDRAALPKPKDPVPDGDTPTVDRETALGAPRFDPRVPANKKVYVDEFPFAITKDDLKRGQERFTMYCAMCHGPLGNGHGKIWERGYLTPTSFHTAPVTKEEESLREVRDGVWYDEKAGKQSPVRLGFSRGYSRWRIDIPMRDVPVGYYFEVISKGYGGMPDYSAQIKPEDRWRIIAYIKVLQLSQHADMNALGKGEAKAGGKP